VAVASRQEGLDPVGATVGQRGGRVQAVVAELGGEKIDIIPWSEDPAAFVANALSPAQVVRVDIDEENRIAAVTVPERMLSLAIGREGQNARLAAKLTGWRIDIRSDQAVGRPQAPEPAPAAEDNTPAIDAGVAADEPVAAAPDEAVADAAAEQVEAPAAAEPAETPAAEPTEAPAAQEPKSRKRATRKPAAADVSADGAGPTDDAAAADGAAPTASEAEAEAAAPAPVKRSRKAAATAVAEGGE
jgi:N utilization substance protein A